MPRRNTKQQNGRKTKSSSRISEERSQTTELREISRYIKSEYNGLLPRTPDIKFPEVRRGKVYTIVRAYTGPLITASQTVDQFGAYQFAISSFAGSSDLTALFDQYRILSLEVSFIPTNPDMVASGLSTVIDYDDASAPSSLAQLMEYDSYQFSASNAITRRTFTPRAALAAYAGTLSTAYALSSANQWFDIAGPNVTYYGIKYWLSALASGTAAQNVYQVIVRGSLQFRSVR